MKYKQLSLTKPFSHNRVALYVYTGLVLITLALLFVSQPARSDFVQVKASEGAVQLIGKLSQTKLAQGNRQTVYLDVGVKTPAQEIAIAPERATDMVIVLDRSGSMSTARKMNYAKAAIRDVLARLNAGDRFALLSFANNSIVHSSLINVDNNNRNYLNNLINNISTGGGTNMGDGLNAALQMLSANNSQRARKVLLLSDGHANQGITDPNQLATIASRITETGSVLSTIGMGLDFNETLMAKLADHGMGHYAYLEDLTDLSTILASNLQDSRNTYANSSHLEIKLGDGVQLIDAGGYPLNHINSNTIYIATGQLLANSHKSFVITFSVPTQSLGKFSLGVMQLVYQQQGNNYYAQITDTHLQMTTLKPARKEEVVHSINHEVFKQSWLKNNLGRMQKKVSDLVRSGDQDKAKQVLSDYNSKLRQAEVESHVPMASVAMDDKIDKIAAEVKEAFAGSRADQEVKRKRAAKSMQYGAMHEQRTTK